VLKRPKRIKRWQPTNFREEMTTVWSFKQRGNWATHNGRYQGNWSPYIPRNLILKYSNPGDVVLDYFVGGGTTAVEDKLLGRRCIARDINPGAVGITLENLRFSPPAQLLGNGALPTYEPRVSVGDARNLYDILDNSVDLIFAHPPYAGIIKYSTKIAGDLSDLSIQDSLIEMRKVAGESLRVLKPGGKCAILIGDARKSKTCGAYRLQDHPRVSRRWIHLTRIGHQASTQLQNNRFLVRPKHSTQLFTAVTRVPPYFREAFSEASRGTTRLVGIRSSSPDYVRQGLEDRGGKSGDDYGLDLPKRPTRSGSQTQNAVTIFGGSLLIWKSNWLTMCLANFFIHFNQRLSNLKRSRLR
jgi:SAM-dependent methyltransferase